MTDSKGDTIIKGAIAEFKAKAYKDLPECPDCGYVGKVRMVKGAPLPGIPIPTLKLIITVCPCVTIHRHKC